MPEDKVVPESGWQFRAEDDNFAVPNEPQIAPVSWTASEFVSHQKNPGWYALIGGGALLGAAAVYLLTRDKISTTMIAIVGIGLAVFGARQPKVLTYKVDSFGMHIGKKSYEWEQFKSFSIIEEGAINSIYLAPMKRLMPAITVYYAPGDEEKIINVIASFLPHEMRERDLVDKLMHKIRF